MRFRNLKIAWSVVCGITCVLLIALWVRSYWHVDSIISKFGLIGSVQGSFVSTSLFRLSPTDTHEWEFDGHSYEVTFPESTFLGFYFVGDASGWIALVPQWFVVFAAVTLAAAPWVLWSKRFSLRTLLITTTLVAVVLGLIVAMLRWQVR
jgi:hypothetical protein